MADFKQNYFQKRTKARGPRSNNRITSNEVQVIASDGENLGILNLNEAINKAKKKQKIVSLKEIKLRPVTGIHDYDFKVKNAKKFITKGDKVKFTIRFKGRELQHSHLGNELMAKIKEDMKDIGKVESQPKFDGKQMIMVIQPL